jgi:hypothetical protein
MPVWYGPHQTPRRPAAGQMMEQTMTSQTKFEVINRRTAFVMATFATIQEANGLKAKLNAAPSLTQRGWSQGNKYIVAQVA